MKIEKVNQVMTCEIIFGRAGVGKTRHIMENFTSPEYLRLAPTGMVAYAIKSFTINSYFCLGLGDVSVESALIRIPSSKKKYLNKIHTLVIDEVFMCDFKIMKKVNLILKKIRKNTDLMGGLNLILVGDDAQLLSIYKSFMKYFKSHYEYTFKELEYDPEKSRLAPDYFAQCEEIRKADYNKYSENPEFWDSLLESFNFAETEFKYSKSVYYTNAEVSRLNIKKNSEFTLEGVSIELDIYYKNNKLKYGIPVMLVKNIDIPRGLYNGRIARLVSETSIEFDDMVYSSNYIDSKTLIPAFAITIHKVQGQTLPCINAYLKSARDSKDFKRLLYVAVTRVRYAENCYLEF